MHVALHEFVLNLIHLFITILLLVTHSLKIFLEFFTALILNSFISSGKFSCALFRYFVNMLNRGCSMDQRKCLLRFLSYPSGSYLSYTRTQAFMAVSFLERFQKGILKHVFKTPLDIISYISFTTDLLISTSHRTQSNKVLSYMHTQGI